ncbi:hypothetical protein [Streptomyces sp. W1SF4]|uniref:hypothetical protein n=1 Tax=Streptomyces sp. W1SF4 TaxID=2305220 RepID=UPI000F71742A|nr:hypothetical protein [Streptomyces sp. W1SF4]AZM93692.1 hypothetical protein D1J60_34720 [Streptomyces sp. W1SF4]
MSDLRILRPGLHYAPVQSGVYFGHGRGQFVLRGPEALFGVADVCVPALEDGSTEDGLVAALGTERSRPVVRLLLKTFAAHGLLLDPARFTAPPPSEEERRRHAGALAELEAASDDPYGHFATLRASAVLLCGPPEAVAPAARGLHRAGVGRLLLAVPDPRAVATTARQLGAEVHALGPHGAPPAADADAYVLCRTPEQDGPATAADAWAAWLERLPRGRPVVPVAFEEAFILVGPVLDGPDAAARRTALHRRIAGHAAARPAAPVTRPVGDALAGALAGRAVFHALTTGADPAEAHLVHGDEPAADRVEAPLHPVGPDAPPVTLSQVPSEPAPAAGETAEAVESLAGPWTGLYSLPTPYDLPQLPVALAEARPARADARSFVAPGDNQQQAALQAALAVLRSALPAGPDAVAAAGTTAERWLLDGALRLLAAGTGPAGTPADFDALAARPRGLWRVLADYEDVPPHVELHELPGLSWPLARVAAQDGTPLAAAWGPDADGAVAEALAGALAAIRTRAARGTGPGGHGPGTAALETADDTEVAALRAEVAAYGAARGLEFTGRPADRDPVLGELPFAHGRVTTG